MEDFEQKLSEFKHTLNLQPKYHHVNTLLFSVESISNILKKIEINFKINIMFQ